MTAQQVKALAGKRDDLVLIPVSHIAEGESTGSYRLSSSDLHLCAGIKGVSSVSLLD